VDQIPQLKKHRHWSWLQFGLALSLILLGVLSLFLGFCLSLGGMKAVGGYFVAAAEIIFVGGIIWIIALLIQFFVLRRRSRRS